MKTEGFLMISYGRNDFFHWFLIRKMLVQFNINERASLARKDGHVETLRPFLLSLLSSKHCVRVSLLQ